MKVYRSIDELIRNKPDFNERWNCEDKGLITAWELGRELAISNPELANKAKNGELPPLGFKGGYERELKSKKPKHGAMVYLAELQGLKGEDLDIDEMKDEGKILTCKRTGMRTIFTFDQNKYKNEA
ncbi:MAG: hypothetical protein EOM50_15945 [Erysipelotrichia bacterium]|nr:hypothetical protein [Erysipelotrichia bacterium]